MDENREILEVLRDIRSNQHKQLEGLQESLSLQLKQYDMARTQFERAERLNDRAEQIQETGARMMSTARKTMVVILPVVIFLVIYLSWLIFR